MAATAPRNEFDLAGAPPFDWLSLKLNFARTERLAAETHQGHDGVRRLPTSPSPAADRELLGECHRNATTLASMLPGTPTVVVGGMTVGGRRPPATVRECRADGQLHIWVELPRATARRLGPAPAPPPAQDEDDTPLVLDVATEIDHTGRPAIYTGIPDSYRAYQRLPYNEDLDPIDLLNPPVTNS